MVGGVVTLCGGECGLVGVVTLCGGECVGGGGDTVRW